ncbi:hypothetical protein BU26DRAFT_134186 [Trematosphaeria pertusa]|uniref:Uncharacterized protein n=1 Tax=Trematosphaeria pertusa TaxID=390896 RepID=A0A6A6IV80_9PLEO|nr:uncharacterized protein BU26DRAFT_134186 [Trematosphaeria pertusa]KAF2254138.1 hypothetical protein BU26DRAFT_134186 [Trematosphaeria pertusa]
MKSRPGSPPTTMASPHGLIDSCDIVTTQGAFLGPCLRTPVFENGYDKDFLDRLHRKLELLVMVQGWRTGKYREAADEWPIGRTPPEIKERRAAEMKAQRELWDSDCSTGDEDPNVIYTRVGPGKTVAAPDRPPRRPTPPVPGQADSLPTPALSTESPLNTSHRTKRRRIPEEGEEASVTTEDAAPNMLQQKRQKRQRAFDVGGGEKGGKERRSKVRVATRTNSTWLERLRPRPKPSAG